MGRSHRRSFITRLRPQMKKYLSLLCLSTKNHNILCFLDVSGTKVINKGICLWKAPKPLAGRGFPPAKTAPKPVQTRGLWLHQPQNPSLVLAGAGDKAQMRCRFGENLCRCGELGRIYTKVVSWDE